MIKHDRRPFIRGLFVSIFTLIVMLSYGIDPAKSLTDSSADEIQRDADYGIMPLFFISNQSQFDELVKYTTHGLTFVLTEKPDTPSSPEPRMLPEFTPQKPEPQASQKSWVVKLDFVGANHNVPPESLEQAETVISYFTGWAKEWKTGLQTSSRIIYRK